MKSAHKPKWWNESFQSSWDKVKAQVLADWDKVVGAEKKLERGITEEAIAFGHGARQAYQKMAVWGGELEEGLKTDWKETGHDAEVAWDKVSAAVKHGWERAKATAGAATSSEKEPAAKADSSRSL